MRRFPYSILNYRAPLDFLSRSNVCPIVAVIEERTEQNQMQGELKVSYFTFYLLRNQDVSYNCCVFDLLKYSDRWAGMQKS